MDASLDGKRPMDLSGANRAFMGIVIQTTGWIGSQESTAMADETMTAEERAELDRTLNRSRAITLKLASLHLRLPGTDPKEINEISAMIAAALEAAAAQARAEGWAAGLEEADRKWSRWLNETRVRLAETDFDVETAIVCGGKQPTLHDAGQVGYAAALFAWEAAIRVRAAEAAPGEREG